MFTSVLVSVTVDLPIEGTAHSRLHYCVYLRACFSDCWLPIEGTAHSRLHCTVFTSVPVSVTVDYLLKGPLTAGSIVLCLPPCLFQWLLTTHWRTTHSRLHCTVLPPCLFQWLLTTHWRDRSQQAPLYCVYLRACFSDCWLPMKGPLIAGSIVLCLPPCLFQWLLTTHWRDRSIAGSIVLCLPPCLFQWLLTTYWRDRSQQAPLYCVYLRACFSDCWLPIEGTTHSRLHCTVFTSVLVSVTVDYPLKGPLTAGSIVLCLLRACFSDCWLPIEGTAHSRLHCTVFTSVLVSVTVDYPLKGPLTARLHCTVFTSVLVSVTVDYPLKGPLTAGSIVLCLPPCLFQWLLTTHWRTAHSRLHCTVFTSVLVSVTVDYLLKGPLTAGSIVLCLPPCLVSVTVDYLLKGPLTAGSIVLCLPPCLFQDCWLPIGGTAHSRLHCTVFTSVLVSVTVDYPLKGPLTAGSIVLCLPPCLFQWLLTTYWRTAHSRPPLSCVYLRACFSDCWLPIGGTAHSRLHCTVFTSVLVSVTVDYHWRDRSQQAPLYCVYLRACLFQRQFAYPLEGLFMGGSGLSLYVSLCLFQVTVGPTYWKDRS